MASFPGPVGNDMSMIERYRYLRHKRDRASWSNGQSTGCPVRQAGDCGLPPTEQHSADPRSRDSFVACRCVVGLPSPIPGVIDGPGLMPPTHGLTTMLPGLSVSV